MQLLPDLTPIADAARGYMYNWSIQGEQLRLTSAIANVGTGALEIRGGATSGNGQVVDQRIYEDDGSFIDVEAGTFEYHPGHGHIHFENFAEFRLREVLEDGSVGDIVAIGDKVSFCLIDVTQQEAGAGPRTYQSCGQVQGISPGWNDVYSSGLPGQYIDIEGVPDGSYWLEVVADPANQLIESDETNNTTRIQIELERFPNVSNPDNFEANNSFGLASVLAPPEDHLYENLSIHETNDDDYYLVVAAGTGDLTFSLDFQHGQGNINMQVFDSNQNLLQSATSTTDDEQITVQANIGDEFYIRVHGNNGATNVNYSLNVDQPVDDHHDDGIDDIPNVTQYLNGVGDHDTFVINGQSADYNWNATEDGTGIVVYGPTGFDLLFGFEHIQFSDREVELNANPFVDDPARNQFVNGTAGQDTFVINADSGAYNWGPTEDGSGVVVYTGAAFDILTDIEAIQFTDRTVSLVDDGTGSTVVDDPANTQHLTGGSGVDRFVVNANAADYNWSPTVDGSGVVVYSGAAFDVLNDFEEIEFNDQIVDISQAAV